MSYSKRTWVNGEILDADKMNHLEQGVYDNSQDIATIDTELDTKANIDGSYEGMTVGNAEQLVSTVGVEDSAPYTFRTTGGSADVGDRMNLKAVVGGTVAWNQLVQTNSASVNVPSVHKYLSRINGTNTIAISNGSAISINDGTKDNVFDLTAMFGSTIADYVYTLESGTAGAGVAWLKKYGYFTKPYYPYKAAALESVKTSAHKTIGFNQWDEELEVGGISSGTGGNVTQNNVIRSKNYIRVIPQSTYYTFCQKTGIGSWAYLFYYDSDKNYIGSSGGYRANSTVTIPSNVYYIRFQCNAEYGTTYNHDICISLHWDGERDGEYEPFEQHTYALDDVELRGIPKLDASNNLYYDGDEYAPDGTVTRKYGIVDLGTLNWTLNSGHQFLAPYSPSGLSDTQNALVSNGKYNIGQGGYNGVDMSLTIKKTYLWLVDGNYSTGSDLQAALSGVYLVYEIETPTTESADSYTELQICDDFGTEEFVDAATRDFEMPVGHNTVYRPNLRAKLEMTPNSPDGDGDYLVRQTNGTNEYVLFSEVKELPDMPTTDGTYVLKCTVSDGEATLSWVSE